VQIGALPVVSSWQGSYGLLAEIDAVPKSVAQWHTAQTLQHAENDAKSKKQQFLLFE
jgi:hypothetical protein